MCGIFGFTVNLGNEADGRRLRGAAASLFRLSESRGKEAAGLSVLSGGSIRVYKAAVAASRMIETKSYRRFMAESLADGLRPPVALIGHARLVTNGRQVVGDNNQPVVRSGLVAVHNGIITNVDQVWRSRAELRRHYEVDTEVLLALIQEARERGKSLLEAVQASFSQIEGTASVALLADDLEGLVCATNNGSFYLAGGGNGGPAVFASEKFILQRFLARGGLGGRLGDSDIRHLAPGQGMVLGLNGSEAQGFSLREGQAARPPLRSRPLPIRDHSAQVEQARSNLKRCTRCVLPETMPFIRFDEQGVCNYCHNFSPMRTKDREALEEAVAPFRRGGSEPDCIVMFSGGRDSSYGLHYIKTELGLNPLAYTYDWGMITDLGRRNQARVCGKLGVEHILVSADIGRKRRNIRKSIEAWLKRPRLGMVPLFMAGDKQYFYYANQLRKQSGVDMVLVCECPLEFTKFKTGFCGVEEVQTRIYNLPLFKRLKLGGYYAAQHLVNPAYFNSALVDSVFAFASSYFISHDYQFLYDFIEWDEERINSTLIGEYDWETDPESSTTWRIGDGTAAFYNYIYYTVAGFTENDTLRSNLIRQGMLSRERALELVERENQPRWQSMEWYSQVIGFDLNEAIQVVNSMPKLYVTE